MARERQLEGGGGGDDAGDEGGETMHFSDVELDEDGNPIDEEEEEEEGEEGEEGDEDDEDRGDEVDPLAEDDDAPGADVDALRAVAGNRTIPKARFDQVLEENRRMRDIIEQAAVGRAPAAAAAPAKDEPPAFDLKGKLEERAAAILEGDTDKIVALDLEIEEHRNTVVRQQGEQAGRQAAGGAIEADRLNAIVNAAFQKYPFLDSDSEDYNAEALGDVMMYRDRYKAEGMSKPDALKKAINRVCPHYADDGGEGDGEGEQRRTPKKPANPNARTPKAIVRNARAGERLPPSITRNGTGGAAATRQRSERRAGDMSGSEYGNMPESEKARLRGDFVTE